MNNRKIWFSVILIMIYTFSCQVGNKNIQNFNYDDVYNAINNIYPQYSKLGGHKPINFVSSAHWGLAYSDYVNVLKSYLKDSLDLTDLEITMVEEQIPPSAKMDTIPLGTKDFDVTEWNWDIDKLGNQFNVIPKTIIDSLVIFKDKSTYEKFYKDHFDSKGYVYLTKPIIINQYCLIGEKHNIYSDFMDTDNFYVFEKVNGKIILRKIIEWY